MAERKSTGTRRSHVADPQPVAKRADHLKKAGEHARAAANHARLAAEHTAKARRS